MSDPFIRAAWLLLLSAFVIAMALDTAKAQDPPADPAEAALWDILKDSDTPEAFRSYLELYPNGRFVDEARRGLAALGVGPETDASADVLTSAAGETGAPQHECYRLAAGPVRSEPACARRRRRGDRPPEAIRECAGARAAFPSEARFSFQLGRAFAAASIWRSAVDAYRDAAQHG